MKRLKGWLLSNKRRAGAIFLALGALAASGVVGFTRRDKGDAGPKAELAEAMRGDLELHFTDSGELAPKSFVDVASKVSGRVIELLADEGAVVKKGQKLAVIQPGRTEAERYVPFTLTSPLDGVVMRYQKQGYNQDEARLSRLSDYVTGLFESNTPTYLMTVADLTWLVVRMKISEMDILKLKEGMEVSVTVDALPQSPFAGKVTLVAPQAEKDQNNLKYFRVEVSLQKSDARLKPGMTARVDGLLEARKGVLKIPLSAVFEERGKEVAYPAGPGRTEPKSLKLGLRNETEAEVLSGAAPGEKFLTEKPAKGPS